MQLCTYHGRKDPAEEMDDWGFDGPTLQDVTLITHTYMQEHRIFFRTREACNIAHRITGWEYADTNALIMDFAGDLLAFKNLETGETAYYGDWEVADVTN